MIVFKQKHLSVPKKQNLNKSVCQSIFSHHCVFDLTTKLSTLLCCSEHVVLRVQQGNTLCLRKIEPQLGCSFVLRSMLLYVTDGASQKLSFILSLYQSVEQIPVLIFLKEKKPGVLYTVVHYCMLLFC